MFMMLGDSVMWGIALNLLVGAVSIGGPDSLEDLAALHGAAVARWESIDGNFEMIEGQHRFVLHYQKSGNRFRCDEHSNLFLPDDLGSGVSRDGKTIRLQTGPTYKKGQALINASGNDPYFRCNPAEQLLFGFLRHPEHAVNMSEFITQPTKSRSISKIRQDGRDLIQLSVSLPHIQFPEMSYDFEYYLDPSINYLARKVIIRINQREDDRTEREVTEFREISPGVFFPTRSKTVHYSKSKPESTSEFRTINLRVNEPIDESAFNLTIPPGVVVRDEILGRQYKTDANGQPIDSKALIPGKMVSSSAIMSGPGTAEPTPYHQRPASEQAGSVFWIILGLTVLGLATVVYFFIRRARRAY